MNLNDLYKTLSVDHNEVLRRFSGHEEIYLKYLKRFPDEPTFGELQQAVAENDTDKIEKTAHTLKGVAGNLGIKILFEASAQLVDAVRAKEYDKIQPLFASVSDIYGNVCSAIKQSELFSEV